MKHALGNWPIMGAALGVVAVSVLGLGYWSNVKGREHYLQSRNFRLLAVVARQTEQMFENRSRVYAKEVAGKLDTIAARSEWIRWPASMAGVPDGAMQVRSPTITAGPPEGALHELEASEVWLGATLIDKKRLARELPRYRSHIRSGGPALQFDWFQDGSKTASKDTEFRVKLPAAEMLGGIFVPKLDQGAFDTLLLADATTGAVVYAAGRRTTEMRTTSVTTLPPLEPAATSAATAAVADTVSERRGLIAGVHYRMFMQPCCRSEDAAGRGAGFIVVGLVESQAMTEASLAISPVLVLAGAVLVVALLVGWSFLKVALIGAQQRVTRLDVMQLGASAILGLALATILLLTTASYARLSADVDAQLEQLADRLDARMAKEIDSAAAQARQMTKTLRESGCVDMEEAPSTGAPPPDPCSAITSKWSHGENLPTDYPDFNAFALIDNVGFQRVKAALARESRPRVAVADRAYFHQARAGEGLWKLATCPMGCILESHWSWTTGKPQVVLSMPTSLRTLPVAALSIPMRPLLEPVVPPGFEFAVIDQSGLVHFHSDTQRNVHENLLLETDQNRRLQSLVTTHSAGTFNTSYWGRPYRAYVRPTVLPGWSVVTLHAKQPGRALVLEWSTVALLMQTGYLLLWIALTVILMASSATWLWPDPLRRPWYRALAIVYVAALILWMAVARRAEPITTLWTGLCLPPTLWALTCAVLVTRPKDIGQPKAWSDLCRDYRLAAALMLVITAAVPGASIFALSSRLHLDAYLKEQQIALVHKVERAVSCENHTITPRIGLDDVRYEDVFYRSQVACAPAASLNLPARSRREAHSKYEDYVPYFTPAAIALRELMHERSDDDAWVSRRPSPHEQAVTVRGDDPQHRLDISSQRLPILGVLSLGDDPHVVRTTVISLLMLVGVALGAYWIVGYLLRRVVLADVVEPVCTNGRPVTSPGQHVLVICDQPRALAKELKDDLVRRLMPIVTAPNVANAWRHAKRALSEIGPLQRIVIPDLDDQSDDVALMRRKLELVEDLMAEPDQTLLLLTRMSKRALAASVRDSWKWSQEPERWSKVLARLTVVDRRADGESAPERAGVVVRAAWWRELRDLMRERAYHLRTSWTGAREPGDWRKDLLDAEAAACKAVEPFCRDLEGTPAFKAGLPSKDQILEELEERAASIYRNLWQSCDESERVVLEHVAHDGLASAASRRAVRRLLARGLLRKDPELRLMNRSFRRFVLETERRREVVALERQAGPSLWDRLRFPLGMAAVIAVVFLAVTQRDAFDATLSMAAGVTTAVPTLAKLMTVIAQFTAKGPGDTKMNA